MEKDITYTSTDGLKLFAKSHGEETAPLTVLCMHGLTRNHKDFEPMIAALQARGVNARFFAVDVRGRCNSERDPKPENYTPATYAGDMVTLLDHLNIERAALIGTSMGGLMSMVMMKMIPDRVLGVAMNDIGPTIEQKGLDRIAGYVGDNPPQPNWEGAAAAVARVQAEAFPDYGDEQWMAFAKRTFRESGSGEVVLDYDPAITRTVGDVRPGIMTRIAMWRLFKEMKRVPLLLVRGGLSDLLSEKTANRMIKRHGSAELVTVPRVGHAPILDEPIVIDALVPFLSRLEARS